MIHHKLVLLAGNVEATQRFLASSQPKLLLCAVALVYGARAPIQGGQHFPRVVFKCFSLHPKGPSGLKTPESVFTSHTTLHGYFGVNIDRPTDIFSGVYRSELKAVPVGNCLSQQMSTDVLSRSLGGILELLGPNTGVVRWFNRARSLLPGLTALSSVPGTLTVDIDGQLLHVVP